MKNFKILTIAAVAAMALMALVAGPASAKVCSASGTGATCAAGHGNVYNGAVSGALSTGKTAKLTSGFVTVSCTNSTVVGNITNGAASPAVGNITSVTFSGCTNNISGGVCTTTTTASTATPWPMSLTTTTAPNGTTTVGSSAVPVNGRFTCNTLGGNRTCIYQTNSASVAFNGGAPATKVATSVPLALQAGSDGLCSASATWSGTYTVSSPASLFAE